MTNKKKKGFDLSELATDPQVLADSKKLITISRDSDPEELHRLLMARMEVTFPSAFHQGKEINLVDLIYLREFEQLRRPHGPTEEWWIETIDRAADSGLKPIADGFFRAEAAAKEHDRWRAEADAIREKHPDWSKSDIARQVIKNLELAQGIEAVRKKI